MIPIVMIFFFFFLHLAAGAEITSVLLYHHHLVASEGQQLLIPCVFKVDDPSGSHQIELGWSVKPNGTDTFTPTIRLDDTGYLPVSKPNERASINLMQVRKGDCSLVINPVNFDDSGTYQVHIAINGMEKAGTEKVRVHVLQRHGTHDLHSEKTYSDRPLTTESFKDHDFIQMAEFIQNIKDKGYFIYLIIGGGVVVFLLVFLLLLSCVAAIVIGCLYRKLGRKIKDASKMMEEGRMPTKSPDYSYVAIHIDKSNQPMKPTDAPALAPGTLPTSVMPKEVVIDMDRCNQQMKPTDATVLSPGTAPAAEFTKQGSMPMKSPEKQDVVIDMDGCNQLMQPVDATVLPLETAPTAEFTKQECMPIKQQEKLDVVNNMDGCNQLMQLVDATVLPLETAPTAEFIKQGCMPMKSPEKQDVVIDMDGCNQLMQPVDATVLPLETAPTAEFTIQECMPIKQQEKLDVVNNMDGCNQLMQPVDATVQPLETAPTNKMPTEGSMNLPEKPDVVMDKDGSNQPTDAPYLFPETVPIAEMTKEGYIPMPKPPEKPVMDMDGCKQPMQPIDATDVPLKTVPKAKRPRTWTKLIRKFRLHCGSQKRQDDPSTKAVLTAEMPKEGCMPMKPEVVIDMDGCKQPMQPIDATDVPLKTVPKAKRPRTWTKLIRKFRIKSGSQKQQDDLSTEAVLTAEMPKEECMPMKPEVVIDMDRCKQSMKPTEATNLSTKTAPKAKRRKTWKPWICRHRIKRRSQKRQADTATKAVLLL